MKSLWQNDLPLMLGLTAICLLVISCVGGEQLPWSYYQNYGFSSVTFTDDMNCNPVWSPDGKRIAFSSDRDGSFDLWLVEARPGNQQPVQVTSGFGDDQHPAWSPDGRRLSFTRWLPGGLGNIYVCPAEENGGTQARCLLEADSLRQYSDPAYDLAGNLYCVEEDLYWNGSRLVRITEDNSTECLFLGLAFVWHPKPTEHGVVLSAMVKGNMTPSIWLFDPEREITKPLLADSLGCWLGTLSPDGRYLAYNARVGGSMKIVVRDLQQNTVQYLPCLFGAPEGASWSPCGKHLCFVDRLNEGQINVFVYTFLSEKGEPRALN